MISSITRKRVAQSLVVATLAASAVAGSFGGQASADPTQLTALVGVGSDTTQEVVNALSGFSSGKNYPAVNSGAATNYKHIISFDATPAQSAGDNCITPIINGPTFTRPNGSTGGRKALFAASGAPGSGTQGWLGSPFTLDSGTVLTTCTTGAVNIVGTVQFARSSALPGTLGTDVIAIPFARDGMSFVSYRPGGGSPLTTLSRAQLKAIYTGATRITANDASGNPVTVIPCGIQKSSGTYSFFRNTVTQSNDANDSAATALCTPTATSRVQENKGDLIKQRGDTLFAPGGGLVGNTNFVVISGYSAAAYIAQSNGVADPNGFNLVQLGSISDDSADGSAPPGSNIGSPVISTTVGTTTTLAPNPTFYASAGVGRDVYNVIRRSNIVNTGTGALLTNAFTALFATPSSAICLATSTVNTFGFASISNCGDYQSATLQRAWDTGNA